MQQISGFLTLTGITPASLTIDTVPEDTGMHPVPVPEPGTLLLLGTGIAATWRRRRRAH